MTSAPSAPLGQAGGPGAVALATALLDRAVEARHRLETPDDAGALHDFRVALRRLRSCLRAYRPLLPAGVTRKFARRLRRITVATSAVRDAEVQLVWLAAREQQASRGERSGVRWFVRQVRERQAASQAMVNRAAQDFDRLERVLRVALAGPARPGPRGAVSSFEAATGGLVLEHAAELGARLAAVASVHEEDEAHRARIRAKRLRYILEPMVETLPAIPGLIDRLRALQDVLGDLHDMHVLAAHLATALESAAVERVRALRHQAAEERGAKPKRNPARWQPGLLALLRQSAEAQRELFARVETDWLGKSLDAFLAEVEATGRSLAAQAAHLEIERKFLLSELPAALAGAVPVEIAQGWLPGDVLQERLRRITTGHDQRYFRTVKLGSGMERLELEEQTTAELFESLWPLTEGRRVAKRRYRRRDRGLVWEVDVFTDRALVLAEVELPTTGAAVDVPAWLQASVVREVTGDPAYVNVNLAC